MLHYRLWYHVFPEDTQDLGKSWSKHVCLAGSPLHNANIFFRESRQSCGCLFASRVHLLFSLPWKQGHKTVTSHNIHVILTAWNMWSISLSENCFRWSCSGMAMEGRQTTAKFDDSGLGFCTGEAMPGHISRFASICCLNMSKSIYSILYRSESESVWSVYLGICRDCFGNVGVLFTL